ncbi:MAG TPA: hypothetical protein VNP72_09695 [Longimicrobium sp.]|nr:hypothetical protein [Longimicrobium sp.]
MTVNGSARLARGGGVSAPTGALRGAWGRFPSVALSLLVAVLPKCSVCLVAHATILGAMGLTDAPQSWPRPVAAVSLAAALGLLAYRAPRRHGYGPALLGCVAALLLLAELTHTHAVPAGVHAAHSPAAETHGALVTWVGVALLMAASLWNAWPSARRQAPCHVRSPGG